MENSA
jgi:hypothetical protein